MIEKIGSSTKENEQYRIGTKKRVRDRFQLNKKKINGCVKHVCNYHVL